MIAQTTSMDNVFLFDRSSFEDHRGTYEELYNKIDYTKAIKEAVGEEIEFLEDNIAVSSRHVLRGFHGDDRTWKLVTCLYGRMYVNVLNYDKDSSNFGKYQPFVLSGENKKQLLIPPKHGNGYVVMSEEAMFFYKQSCIYKGMANQFTVKYDDPRFNVWWPISDPILSKRDMTGEIT
ncbi:MAG: dTDP-4-dehydrorhamnose 3,5-epimerase family protein [Candidatus Asgardarchaeia archaeon]